MDGMLLLDGENDDVVTSGGEEMARRERKERETEGRSAQTLSITSMDGMR